MKKKFVAGLFRLTLLVLAAAGLGYVRFPALTGSALPEIAVFRVSSPVITSGNPVKLSWNVENTDSAKLLFEEEAVTYPSMSVNLEPALSATYTLVAQNRFGSVQQTRRVEVRGVKVASVSGGAAGGASGSNASGGAASEGGGDDEAPEGTLGVSLSPDGPFVNDEASRITGRDDKRVLEVAPGGEFYLELQFSDPGGIAQVLPLLVNGRPEGLAGALSPDRPPFSVFRAPTGDCQLGSLPTTVRCVFPVRVADDARNISELPGSGDEFAYVFRPRATDGLGNSAKTQVRGYVVVTSP